MCLCVSLFVSVYALLHVHMYVYMCTYVCMGYGRINVIFIKWDFVNA